tara:strand:- start:1314 stop:3242 length:1929 start_codon:yes stop_codon:yes gene_type:complete
MATNGGFFSGSAKKDQRIAGDYTIEDKKNVINYYKSGRDKPKQYELESLLRQQKAEAPTKSFFTPSGNEVGQIASATTDLSGLFSQLPTDYKETEQKVIQDNKFNKYIDSEFGSEENLGPGDKYFLRESFDEGNPYKRFNFNENQSFKTPTTDTKIALGGDNLGSMGAIGGALGIFGLGLRGIQSAIEGGKRLRENLDKKLNPEQNNVSIGDRVGNFLNTITGTQSVAAGTLDDNQQVSQVSERPKLNYVNPDAKTMTMSQIGEAFKPKNLFGYQDKFGRYDDPGSPLDRQRQETMQNVYNRFTRPITPDARTIGQIRADQKESMQEAARLRYQDFKNRPKGPAADIQKTFGADDTYGTNVPSNPAMGFRDQMSAVDKARYDKAAKEATAGAQTDPSLGNVFTQTYNRIAKRFGLPQKSLETVDQRQLRKAQEVYNRPRYQQEAYARKQLGITNDMLKADARQRIRLNAEARTRAFNLQKAIKASERSARRLGGNIGTGRDGGFGTGTEGKGLPSNPKGFSGYSRRKSSPSTGTGTSKSRGGISKSTSRGQGGGPSSRSKGGVSRGGSKSNTGSKKASRGTAGSSSKGGSFGGGKKSNTGSKKSARRCDIRTKIDISSLTNQNLIRDDLANVAYFVKELREK